MPKEPTIADLMNEGSIQRIQKMFNAFGFEIKMDPFALANKNQSKESIMSQVLNDLDNSPRIIKLLPKVKTDITDREDIEAANKDKNLKDSNFYNLIRCLILNSLRDEAALILYQKELLKEMQVALHHYIMQLKAAERYRQVNIEDEEEMRFKMREFEAKLNSCVSNVLAEAHANSLSKLNDIHDEITDYHARLSQHKERKKELKSDLKIASQNSAENIIKNNVHFKELSNNPHSQNALADFIYEYKEKLSKIERALYRMDERAKKAVEDENLAQKRELELNDKLKQLAMKEIELKHQFPEGYPPVGRYAVKGRILDPGQMDMIKFEANEIRAELRILLDERNERNRKQANRDIKVANFEKKRTDLFDNIYSKTTDENLKNILQNEDAKKFLLSEMNTKTDPEHGLMENHKEKVQVKGLLKEKHKEATKIIVQNDKVHALHGIASKHHGEKFPDKRHELHQIHQSIEAHRGERKRQKHENKERKAGLR
jgi:hypothetical protein